VAKIRKRSTTAHKSSARTWMSAPDVSDLEAGRIEPRVSDLRVHLPVLAEFTSLVSLQIGVDNSRDEIEAEL
jgi:predicted transcriptional regulator